LATINEPGRSVEPYGSTADQLASLWIHLQSPVVAVWASTSARVVSIHGLVAGSMPRRWSKDVQPNGVLEVVSGGFTARYLARGRRCLGVRLPTEGGRQSPEPVVQVVACHGVQRAEIVVEADN
jgi:hypothetical protein